MNALFNRLRSRLHVVATVCFVFSFVSINVCAEIIMTAPPRENSETGEQTYGPLAEHLSELLGEKVIYKQAKNWLEYQRDLRHDVYDIVFDGPHFVSWRMAHLKHEVLVKLPGSLEFVVIIAADDNEIKEMKDLIGKRVCGIPPPNLATLTVIEQFPNPVRQPIIWGVPGGFKAVFNSFKTKQCRAAVFRTTFYEKNLSEEDRKLTRILFRSKALPNQAISVSKRISEKNKNKIIRSLTLGPQGKKAAQPIVKRFGDSEEVPFIAAKKDEYTEHTLLLEGVVFGW